MRYNICVTTMAYQQLEFFPDDIRVERIDPDQNMHRFYRLRTQPDLFGGVTLFRELGRIGTSGSQMIENYRDAGQAANALISHLRLKTKRGYCLPTL